LTSFAAADMVLPLGRYCVSILFGTDEDTIGFAAGRVKSPRPACRCMQFFRGLC